VPHRIAVFPGDGIGPEVTAEAVATLRCAASERFEFIHFPHGAERALATGETISADELAAVRADHAAVFLGALGDARIPDHRHARDILLGMRRQFDLYLNYRPARLRGPALTPLKGLGAGDIDLVLFRENTEGLYVDIGGRLRPDTPDEVAFSQMVTTRSVTERLVRAAFAEARTRPRARCCLISKHNAVTHTYGLWLRVFREVAVTFPDVVAEVLFVDTAAMELVRDPGRFDVIVASNLFGDILSDLAAQLVGGLGLAPSGNLNLEPGRRFGLFEPVHGSAPDLVGTGRANPLAACLSAAMMARFLGEADVAVRIERACDAAIASGETTPDLGGALDTRAAGDAIRARLEA
jgi:3-isopropylmalate dehydrogenase